MNDNIYFVEGALFSAGSPISVKELSMKLDLSTVEVRRSLKKLVRLYANRKTALQVVRMGSKYGMCVRREFQNVGQKFSPTRIPSNVLKLLSLIAYKQPIKQSSLVKMMGYRVYDRIKKLRKLGLVHRHKEGHTYLVMTTSRFSEQFGIESTKPEDVKNWVRERLSNSYEEMTLNKLTGVLEEEDIVEGEVVEEEVVEKEVVEEEVVVSTEDDTEDNTDV